MVLGLASTVGRKITLLGTTFRQKQKRKPEINSSVNTTYELAYFTYCVMLLGGSMTHFIIRESIPIHSQ